MNNYLELIKKLQAKLEKTREKINEATDLESKSTEELTEKKFELEEEKRKYNTLLEKLDKLKNYDILIANIKKKHRKIYFKEYFKYVIYIFLILLFFLLPLVVVNFEGLKILAIANICFNLFWSLITYIALRPSFNREIKPLFDLKNTYAMDSLEKEISLKKANIATLKKDIKDLKSIIKKSQDDNKKLNNCLCDLEEKVRQIEAKITSILETPQVEEISNAKFFVEETLARTLIPKIKGGHHE